MPSPIALVNLQQQEEAVRIEEAERLAALGRLGVLHRLLMPSG